MNKKRILDSYFLDLIRKKGIQATQAEVTKFFEENGWRFYDFESMTRKFMGWRTVKG